MGICWCKQKEEDHDTYIPQQHSHSISSGATQPVSPVSTQNTLKIPKTLSAAYVDKLVLETLGVIATLVDK